MRDSRTALYRHYDEGFNLLYVGISLSAINRLAQHNDVSSWADKIRKVTVEYFPNRRDAEIAETKAIREEGPIYNIAKRSGVEEHKKRVRIDVTKIRLLDNLVNVEPLYTLREASSALRVSSKTLSAMLTRCGINTFKLPGDERLNPPDYVTGWQLIDLLEMLGYGNDRRAA